MVQDQTERERAADALRESEERFRLAFQTSPDAICINRLDDGACLAANDGFTHILGWTEAEVRGHSGDIRVWDDRRTALDCWRSCKRADTWRTSRRCSGPRAGAKRRALCRPVCFRCGGSNSSFQSPQTSATGRGGSGAGSASRKTVTGGQVGGHRAACRRRRARLQQPAHRHPELCRSLNRGGQLPAGQPAWRILGEIKAAGERARDLTRQLLTFARRQVIIPEPLHLGHAIRGCEKLLRRVLGEDVDLVVSAQRDLWLVRCDPGQVEQIVMNLAVNARDAMPSGGKLKVEATNWMVNEAQAALYPEIKAGEYVRLFVQDTGTGMTAEVKERIFEPFFTTKEAGRGSGLGLATVFGIVKQSGGFIRVESESGRGTAFEICLPRTLDAPVPSRAATKASSSCGTERILLVEDDASVREVTNRALRAGGYEVLVARGPAEALNIAREQSPLHLLITDVVMPGLGGRELAQQVSQGRQDLRVLFISGYAENALSREGVLDPGVDLLLKPFTAASLLAVVRGVLDRP